MRYKEVVARQLGVIVNRLEGLKANVDANKLTKEEISKQLELLITASQQSLEKVELEDETR